MYENSVQISGSFKSIAASCNNKAGDFGILASVERENGDVVAKTDANWRCSSNMSTDWQNTDFSGHSRWPHASTVIPIDDSSSLRTIDLTAEWIWTKGGEATAYCRYQVKGRYY